MSVKVMTWLWENSPAKGSQLLLLLSIADEANDQGANAFPSIGRLAAKTRLNERTVQRLIDRLVADGVLLVERRGGGRRANTYRIVMDQPVDSPAEPVDSGPPSPRRNATPGKTPGRSGGHRRGGVGATPGVAQLRRPTRDVPGMNPPPSRERASNDGGGGGTGDPDVLVSDVESEARGLLAGLPAPWHRLTVGQRDALVPMVVAALCGRGGLEAWQPGDLAAELAAGNTDGVRSPYAVLRHRLQALPAPPSSTETPARPPHCGVCTEATRLRDTVDGRRAYPCPVCHPDPGRRTQGARIEAAEAASEPRTASLGHSDMDVWSPTSTQGVA